MMVEYVRKSSYAVCCFEGIPINPVNRRISCIHLVGCVYLSPTNIRALLWYNNSSLAGEMLHFSTEVSKLTGYTTPTTPVPTLGGEGGVEGLQTFCMPNNSLETIDLAPPGRRSTSCSHSRSDWLIIASMANHSFPVRRNGGSKRFPPINRMSTATLRLLVWSDLISILLDIFMAHTSTFLSSLLKNPLSSLHSTVRGVSFPPTFILNFFNNNKKKNAVFARLYIHKHASKIICVRAVQHGIPEGAN